MDMKIWEPLKLEETGIIMLNTVLEKIYDYFSKPITSSEVTYLTNIGHRSSLEAARWTRNRDARSYQPSGGGDFLRSDLLGQARRFGGLEIGWQNNAWKVRIRFSSEQVPMWWVDKCYG